MNKKKYQGGNIEINLDNKPSFYKKNLLNQYGTMSKYYQ